MPFGALDGPRAALPMVFRSSASPVELESTVEHTEALNEFASVPAPVPALEVNVSERTNIPILTNMKHDMKHDIASSSLRYCNAAMLRCSDVAMVIRSHPLPSDVEMK